jgi:hypothetical protein
MPVCPTYPPCPRSVKRIAPLFMAVVLSCAPRLTFAQRQTYTNTGAWFVISADVAINERWAVLFDASARRSCPLDEATANFVRGGLAYEITDHVRVAAGANWSRSYPYGEIPSPTTTDERRFWEQVQVGHSIGRLDLSHRYRLEQRYRGRWRSPDDDQIDSWERSNRFRYQVKGTLPLSGDGIEPGEAYVSAANELFIGFGGKVQTLFDQDRATVTLGYRMTRNWRVEAGFLEHVIFKPNGTDVERNHTVTFALLYSRPAPVAVIGTTPSR